METRMMELSAAFWKALEKRDTAAMRSICDPGIVFVHIGGNCDLEQEMKYFDDGVFMPTEVNIRKQEAREFGEVGIILTNCDYGLLLDGKETTHHFEVTEVYQKQGNGLKLIQFTFTALVN